MLPLVVYGSGSKRVCGSRSEKEQDVCVVTRDRKGENPLRFIRFVFGEVVAVLYLMLRHF